MAVTCRVLEIACQPYYRWLANPITDAEWEDAHRLNALIDAHQDALSSGIGTWPMKQPKPGTPWPTAPPGDYATPRACSR